MSSQKIFGLEFDPGSPRTVIQAIQHLERLNLELTRRTSRASEDIYLVGRLMPNGKNDFSEGTYYPNTLEEEIYNLFQPYVRSRECVIVMYEPSTYTSLTGHNLIVIRIDPKLVGLNIYQHQFRTPLL